MYHTTNDVIYACVSLCEWLPSTCPNTHMYFACLYQWAYVYPCSYHETLNKQVLLSIYTCTFNYVII